MGGTEIGAILTSLYYVKIDTRVARCLTTHCEMSISVGKSILKCDSLCNKFLDLHSYNFAFDSITNRNNSFPHECGQCA
jgi:hypothetical protein